MKKVLVTGANGFVGSHLVELLKHDFEVYRLDKTASTTQHDRLIICDITQPSSIENALKDLEFDFVVHCAAIAHNDDKAFSDEDFVKVNVSGTENMVQYFADKSLKLFVLFSTIAVYGERNYSGEVSEQHMLRPCAIYAKSKVLAEQACLGNPDFPATVLRFPPIYSRNFLKDLCKRISPMTDRFRIQIGEGRNRYSLCAVKNACDAVRFVLQHPEATVRRVFNVTDPEEYDHTQLLQQLELIIGHRPCVRMPRAVVRAFAELIGFFLRGKREQLRSYYWKLAEDNVYSSRALRKLGFDPTMTLFELTQQQTSSKDSRNGW